MTMILWWFILLLAIPLVHLQEETIPWIIDTTETISSNDITSTSTDGPWTSEASQCNVLGTVQSSYSSELTYQNLIFEPPYNFDSGEFYYEVISVVVNTNGCYRFSSEVASGISLYLYVSNFFPKIPYVYLVQYSISDGSSSSVSIVYNFEVDQQYYLVVTSLLPDSILSFNLLITGPTTVNYSKIADPVLTRYESFWTAAHPTFTPPGTFGDHFYVLLLITTVADGNYEFQSERYTSTYGLLYSPSFDPTSPSTNLLASSNSADNWDARFRFNQLLEINQSYYLVITTSYPEQVGTFDIFMEGPGILDITPLTNQTYINITYESEWRTDGLTFQPPYQSTGDYYFDVFTITAPNPGQFTLRAMSSIPTIGYLYYPLFDYRSPLLNVWTYYDQPTGDGQYDLSTYFSDNRTFYLVLTTQLPATTGAFTLLGSGLIFVDITHIGAPVISQTNYAFNWTLNHRRFLPPVYFIEQFSYYESIIVTIASTTVCVFESNSSFMTNAYLYYPTFDETSSSTNLIQSGATYGGQTQYFAYTLEANVPYYLVISINNINETTPFIVTVRSLAPSNLTKGPDPLYEQTSYHVSITSNYPTFERPFGSANYYYYNHILLNVPLTGNYTINIASYWPPTMYIYYPNFYETNSSENLIMYNDNTGSRYTISSNIVLEQGQVYHLILTSFYSLATPTMDMLVRGPHIVNLTQVPSNFTVQTNFDSFWTTNNPTITLVNGSPADHYYVLLLMTITLDGTYRFTSTSSVRTYGRLYSPTFDPTSPATDLIVSDGGGSNSQGQFIFQQHLQANQRYYLVVTSSDPAQIGTFTVIVQGLATVDILPITVPTYINATLNASLTTTSPTFQPPYFTISAYYILILLSVSKSTTVMLRSESSIDIYGYLYSDNFYPAFPYSNLLVSDDDSGGNGQFQMYASLNMGQLYYLVVTAKDADVTGTFAIITGALASTSLIIPSGLPTITTSFYSVLNEDSAIFQRPDGYSDDYYYELFIITTDATDNYTISTETERNVMGFLYSPAFDHRSPLSDLVAYSQYNYFSGNYEIKCILEAGTRYFLVLTTFNPSHTASFNAFISGPVLVTVIPITIPTIFNSTYQSSLSSSSPTFQSPAGTAIGQYYYELIRFNVELAGTYTLESHSSVDMDGLIYTSSFDPTNPINNLYYSDTNSAGYGQFLIRLSLSAYQDYYLVVTTNIPDTMGPFYIIGSGRSSINFTYTAPPIAITSNYTSAWTSSSPTFVRPYTEGLFYYDTILVKADVAGTYTFESESLIDTYGLLYFPSFDPIIPTSNIAASDDDSGIDTNFKFSYDLEAYQEYYLVATTYSRLTLGDFRIIVKGPSMLSLTKVTLEQGIHVVVKFSLTSSSPTFFPPYTQGVDYPYDGIQLKTNTSGYYVFHSSDAFRSAGILYYPTFTAADSSANIVTGDYNNVIVQGFRFTYYLEADQYYYLIVTTRQPNQIGSFNVTIGGPSYVKYTRIEFPSNIITQYRSSLSIFSPSFNWSSVFTGEYYYSLIRIVVNVTDRYKINSESSMDTYGLLYQSSFDPTSPSSNLLTDDDDSGGLNGFRIGYELSSDIEYFLVVTSYYPQQTESFQVTVVGPATVEMTEISQQTVINTTHSTKLTSTDRAFHRFQGSLSQFYYKLYRLTVTSSASYQFKCSGPFGTVGYLYKDNFIATSPKEHLITKNDRGGRNHRFQLTTQLQAGETYFLVVSTFEPERTGNITVIVRGQTSVDLIPMDANFSLASELPSSWITEQPMLRRYRRGNRAYRLRLFQLTVPQFGFYSLSSLSTVDTYACLYTDQFDPDHPERNLLTYNDQSGGDDQFRMSLILQADQIYYLVATTFRPWRVGNFSVRVTGPGAADMTEVSNEKLTSTRSKRSKKKWKPKATKKGTDKSKTTFSALYYSKCPNLDAIVTDSQVVKVQLPPRSLTGQSWSHKYLFFNRDDPILIDSYLKTITIQYATRGIPSPTARIYIYTLLQTTDGFLICNSVEIPSVQISTDSVIQNYTIDDGVMKLVKGSHIGVLIDDLRASVAMTSGGHLMYGNVGGDRGGDLVGRALKFQTADPKIGVSLAYTVVA